MRTAVLECPLHQSVRPYLATGRRVSIEPQGIQTECIGLAEQHMAKGLPMTENGRDRVIYDIYAHPSDDIVSPCSRAAQQNSLPP